MENELTMLLPRATEELYGVFARYKLPILVQGCSHCVTRDDELRLHSAPLRNLQRQDLAKFAFKAMTTWGSADDFRHFLTRIFELIWREGLGWVDVEVAFGKLTSGNWKSWPADEQSAVRSFLRAMWLDVLGKFPHSLDVDACVCSIGQAEDDLSWYLDAWNVAGCLSAARHFAEFLEENAPSIYVTSRHPWKLRNAFWGERSEQAQQVMQWVMVPARSKDLETAFFSFGEDSAMAQLLSDALNRLSWIQQATGLS